MSFLIFIAVLSILAYLPQHFSRYRGDLRMAMRHGIAGGFLFTGVDHFLNTHTRYVPMMPDFLADYAALLVYVTGAAEIAGALGLLIPSPRKWAGRGLAILLASIVVANINVAIKGIGVDGLPFGSWYFWLRPALQPVFVLWVLYVSSNVRESPRSTNVQAPSDPMMRDSRRLRTSIEGNPAA